MKKRILLLTLLFAGLSFQTARPDYKQEYKKMTLDQLEKEISNNVDAWNKHAKIVGKTCNLYNSKCKALQRKINLARNIIKARSKMADNMIKGKLKIKKLNLQELKNLRGALEAKRKPIVEQRIILNTSSGKIPRGKAYIPKYKNLYKKRGLGYLNMDFRRAKTEKEKNKIKKEINKRKAELKKLDLEERKLSPKIKKSIEKVLKEIAKKTPLPEAKGKIKELSKKLAKLNEKEKEKTTLTGQSEIFAIKQELKALKRKNK